MIQPRPTTIYVYGCARGCYRTLPQTLPGTPHTRCPLCGAAWVLNPPPPQSLLTTKGGPR